MDALSFFSDYLGPRILLGLQAESIRYALGTLTTFVVIWVLLARFIQGRKIRATSPRGPQIRTELLNSARTMAIFTAMDILIFEAAGLGIFRKYDDISSYGWTWFLVSIPLWIILHDAYFYWTHRALHHARIYKHTHITHHRSHNPSPFTAYSFDPVEAVVMYLFVPVALMFVPTHGLAFYIVMTIMIFKNALGHCGYEVFPRRWARMPVLGWLTTVTHHDMHHERGTGNFGFYFTWWDRWMGTEHPTYLQRLDEQAARARALRESRKKPPLVAAE